MKINTKNTEKIVEALNAVQRRSHARLSVTEFHSIQASVPDMILVNCLLKILKIALSKNCVKNLIHEVPR